MRGITQKFPFAGIVLPGPVPGQKGSALIVETRIVFLQPCGYFALAAIAVHAGRPTQFVQPPRIAIGRLLRRCCRHPESFEIDQPSDALGAHTGIQHDDVAPHAVPDQIGRLIGRIMLQYRVHVAQIIRKPVGIGAGWLRQADAAPVGSDYLPTEHASDLPTPFSRPAPQVTTTDCTANFAGMCRMTSILRKPAAGAGQMMPRARRFATKMNPAFNPFSAMPNWRGRPTDCPTCWPSSASGAATASPSYCRNGRKPQSRISPVINSAR